MAEKGVVTVTFERGLNEYIEASRLEIGFATILENWVPEPDGSLRTRVAWNEVAAGYDGTPAEPADKRVRGIGINPKHLHMGSTTPGVLVANAETDVNPGYRFYHVPLESLDDAMHNWEESEFHGGAGYDNTKPVAMVMAGGRLLYCTDDFSLIRAWKGTDNTVATIADSRVGRCMTYYKSRVFTAGGVETVDPVDTPENVNTYSTQPWRLWFSGIIPADITADAHWDTTSISNPAGFIEVGKDDGQPIEFIVPFDQGILIGKSESLYYLVGDSPATFKLLPLDAGECAPGRSICVTPYGAVILGKGEAFIFKGNIPEPIDTPVSESYGITGEYISAAYNDGNVYVVDEGRDLICVYDLENDAWRTEAIGVAPGFIYAHQEHLLVGPQDDTGVLMRHRELPMGARTVDDGLGLVLHAKTPEMWLGGVSSRFTVRHCYVRYRQRGGDAGDAELQVKQYKNGALLTTSTITPEAAAGVYRKRLDLKGTMNSCQFEFIQANGPTDEAVFDIEEIEIHIDTEPVG